MLSMSELKIMRNNTRYIVFNPFYGHGDLSSIQDELTEAII